MPSNFERVVSISRLAGQDLSGAATQYLFGLINPNSVTGASPDVPGVYGAPSNITVDPGNVIVNTVNGGQCECVIVGKAPFGAPIECAIGGRVLVIAGAAIAAGAQVQSNAAGQAITQSGSGHILGITLEAASAAGDQISIIWSPRGEA